VKEQEKLMICVLHGYLVVGSGSNLWTRLLVEALCRQGETVHVMCQENHPERYPFIREQRRYARGAPVLITRYPVDPTNTYEGGCILHKPILGNTLPVFVWDRYEEFSNVIPMVEMADEAIEDYVEWNAEVLTRIVRDNAISAIHANHGVLMPQVAMRVKARTGVPFALMPHGSELEYAIKRDPRFRVLAEDAIREVSKIFVHGEEMRSRVLNALPNTAGMEAKFVDLHLGVNTKQFRPTTRSQRTDRIHELSAVLGNATRGRERYQTEGMRAALDEHLSDNRGDSWVAPIDEEESGEITVGSGTQMLMTAKRGASTRTAPRPTTGQRRPPGPWTVDRLTQVFDAARDYDNKAPDADVEYKLSGIDWDNDTTLLYVGRLISTKGVQSVIAALPLLLEQNPELHLIVVGHGPLREPLEAMLWAMEHGDMGMLRMIAENGRTLEKSPQGDSGGTTLTQMCYFLDDLEERGLMNAYATACRLVKSDTVVFTGYLTHRELRCLFPCCDAAVFPSVIKEAGPLVFLEALASGAFPLGTYFGGMRASIDSVARVLPESAVDVMKLSADPHQTIADIVTNVPRALAMGDLYKSTLFNFTREHYDWTSVADEFRDELEEM
jgi:glycosyltransferase involved in cell wall biosynthesis